ncbi:MAG: hypothetical protein IPL35_10530 [Sphingobacteriales bacterium]|nr:hypothetical protein [Sphingobacteriales bacterium]
MMNTLQLFNTFPLPDRRGMKWLLPLIVWALFAPPPEARAQNAEFAPIGAKWNLLSVQPSTMGKPANYYHYLQVAEKDTTLINEENATILRFYLLSGTPHPYYNPKIIQQKGDTILYLAKNKFYPLYRVNAQVGDEWSWYLLDKFYLSTPNDSIIGEVRFKVDSIAYITIDGQTTRRQYVSHNWLYIDENDQNDFDFYFWDWIDDKVGGYPYFYPFIEAGFVDVPSQTYVHCYEDEESNITYPLYQFPSTFYMPNEMSCDAFYFYVGIDDYDDTAAYLFPNPAHQYTTVHSDTPLQNIVLYAKDGSKIEECLCRDTDCRIETSHLPIGFYIVAIPSKNNTVQYHKLFINH